MATAKGKRPASNKKGTASKSTAKRGSSAKGRKSAKRRSTSSSPAIGMVFIGLGIFMLFCLLTQSNAIALTYVRGLVNSLFGQLGWAVSVLVFWLGLQISLGDKLPVRASTLPLCAALVFCIMTLLQVFKLDELLRELRNAGYQQNYNGFLWKSYEASKNIPRGGGFLGALLGYPMGKSLDVLGSVLLLFFAIGALLLAILRGFFPSMGEAMGGWWSQFRDDMAERRELRDAERAEREAEEEAANEALLVPLPRELMHPDEPEEAPAKKVAKGRKVAATAQPAPPPPAPPVKAAPAKTPVVKAPAAAPKFTPPAKGANASAGRQPTLYIEDILPDTPYVAADDAYTDYDVERSKFQSRPSRKNPSAVPDFIAKRRAEYEADYGVFDDLGEDTAEETAPTEMYEPVSYEPEPLPAYEPEPPAYSADETTLDDASWAPIEPVYAPQPDAPAPTRRRRARTENPLDSIPELDPQTRLDRPDWKPAPEPVVETTPEMPEYRQPPFSLLERDDGRAHVDTREQDAAGAQKLEDTLASFGVDARVIKVVHGPAITRYELQPAPGVKVSKIVNLTDDIALNMAAVGVRIEAPIPGKAAIGMELANDEVETVRMRDVLESDEVLKHPSRLAVALGKDIAGKRIIADLARMPHLLIAGATGSGKSVCINTIITSIIYRATPEEVRLILIDPKKVELSVYDGIPHLLVPVVTDPKKASGALNWAVMEMDERYRVFAAAGVRDIKGYNAQRGADIPLMPQIVVIIDELSDLMLVAPGEVEESICRIAQLARACGIHLVIATQRPSVNVITGIIKANVPSRIAFAVSSQVDSRTILDGAGAEKLLGKGDMLFAPAGGGKPTRVQGCFVSDGEVARVTEYVRDRHTADYDQTVLDALAVTEDGQEPADEDLNESSGDALFQQAVEMAVESGQASISMLQRRLRVGYARAGRLIDEMARRNIIGQAEGAKPREVLITQDDMRLLFKK